MRDFKREERYIVVKLKHLAGLQQAPLRNFLRENRVPQIECVVVEHDWPEYHLVWAMIEHRMAGKPVPNFNDWRRADELQQLLTAADERVDVLEGLLREVDSNGVSGSLSLRIRAALKPAEVSGSTCNQIREESGLPTNNPCQACGHGACIDR